MSSVILHSSDASFSGNVPRVRLPFQPDCLGYFLFGGSSMEEVRNRAGAGPDLIPIGGGPVARTATTSTLSTTAGFRTAFDVIPYAVTVLVVADAPTANADGTPDVNGNPTPNAFYYASAMDNSLSFALGPGGADSVTGSGGGDQSVPITNAGVPVYLGRQQLRAVSEVGGTLSYYAEAWSALLVFAAAGKATPTRAPSKLLIGAGKYGTAYSRVSAAAVYGRGLSEAEVRAVYRTMKEHATARGVLA